MSEYDPNDLNAVISNIHAELRLIRETQLENRDKLDASMQRIAALETFKIWIVGAAAGVSALVTFVIAGVKWIVSELKP